MSTKPFSIVAATVVAASGSALAQKYPSHEAPFKQGHADGTVILTTNQPAFPHFKLPAYRPLVRPPSHTSSRKVIKGPGRQ